MADSLFSKPEYALYSDLSDRDSSLDELFHALQSGRALRGQYSLHSSLNSSPRAFKPYTGRRASLYSSGSESNIGTESNGGTESSEECFPLQGTTGAFRPYNRRKASLYSSGSESNIETESTTGTETGTESSESGIMLCNKQSATLPFDGPVKKFTPYIPSIDFFSENFRTIPLARSSPKLPLRPLKAFPQTRNNIDTKLSGKYSEVVSEKILLDNSSNEAVSEKSLHLKSSNETVSTSGSLDCCSDVFSSPDLSLKYGDNETLPSVILRNKTLPLYSIKRRDSETSSSIDIGDVDLPEKYSISKEIFSLSGNIEYCSDVFSSPDRSLNHDNREKSPSMDRDRSQSRYALKHSVSPLPSYDSMKFVPEKYSNQTFSTSQSTDFCSDVLSSAELSLELEHAETPPLFSLNKKNTQSLCSTAAQRKEIPKETFSSQNKKTEFDGDAFCLAVLGPARVEEWRINSFGVQSPSGESKDGGANEKGRNKPGKEVDESSG